MFRWRSCPADGYMTLSYIARSILNEYCPHNISNIASASKVLNIESRGAGLTFRRPPAGSLRHGVMVKSYDGVCGDGAAASGLVSLEDRYVNVADPGGYRVPVTMQTIWEAIVNFFRDDGGDEEGGRGTIAGA